MPSHDGSSVLEDDEDPQESEFGIKEENESEKQMK